MINITIPNQYTIIRVSKTHIITCTLHIPIKEPEKLEKYTHYDISPMRNHFLITFYGPDNIFENSNIGFTKT